MLLITSEALEELRALGFTVYPGALGENLTTSGLERRSIRLGDSFRIGQGVIEITKMRAPCATLDVFNQPGGSPIQNALYDLQVRAGNATSPRWGMSGFYARVLSEGLVRTGDRVELLERLT